jgi:C-terminal processing protease CtpA/Prc
VDDSKTIDNWISGTSTTTGFDFMLAYIGSTSNLFGFVRYVYKNSPAEKAGLKRGDIFITVNGKQLTVSNYQTLLFNATGYTLGFATITNHTISPNNRTMALTAIEMQEDPVLLDTVFVYHNQKIGYLVYNGFNADFDLELNDAFQQFKNAGIDQLIIDLRYNGGGSVQSAIYLGSMIYGTDPKKIFAVSQYNAELEDYLVSTDGASSLNDYFTGNITATQTHGAAAINTLNMGKVYFIVSDNTASASELLINALKPYMNVVVVGINTVGKYVGSTTIKDWTDNQGNVNPNNPYAMQPIIVKFANSAGVTDYVNGLTPDIHGEEDIANLMPFGDPTETLLSYVLGDISGTQVVSQTLKSATIGLRKVADSRKFKPFANDMYITPKTKYFMNSK